MTHSFDPAHAVEFGMVEAVLIHSFQWWLTKNQAEAHHIRDGHTWSYNSYAALAKQFPYLTERQVRHAMDNLCERGVLIKRQMNLKNGDARNWYAFADEKRFLGQVTLEGDTISQKAQMGAENGRSKRNSSLPTVSASNERTNGARAGEVSAEEADPHLKAVRLVNEHADALTPLGWGVRTRIIECAEFYLRNGHEVLRSDFEGAISDARKARGLLTDPNVAVGLKKTVEARIHSVQELPHPARNGNGKARAVETNDEVRARLARERAAKAAKGVGNGSV